MSKPSQDQFAELVKQALLTCGVKGTLSYDRSAFGLYIKDDRGVINSSINLAGYFHDYCKARSSDERELVIASITNSSTTEIPESYDEAKNRIYPHVQDLWTRDEMKLSLALGRLGNGNETGEVFSPCATFAGSFAGVLAYDLPTTRIILNSTIIDRWQVDFRQIFEEALERLAQRTHGEWMVLDDEGATVYFSTWKDGYDAARIFFPDMLSELQVRGNQVVFLPSAEQMIITGSDDPVGMTIALASLEAAQQEERKPLPPIPIEISEGALRKLRLPVEHPLHYGFKRNEIMYFSRIYEHQKSYLEGTYEAIADEIFIAKYVGLADDKGRAFSSCVLTEGVTTLLPKTEMIRFVRVYSEQDVRLLASGRWERVAQIAPDLLEEMDYYPPRYRAVGFPSDSQLAQIGMEEAFFD